MTIADAAATRKYAVWRKKTAAFVVSAEPVDLTRVTSPLFKTRAAAQDACDRLNLIAVLEEIREPSKRTRQAIDEALDRGPGDLPLRIQYAMIDALIAEAKEQAE